MTAHVLALGRHSGIVDRLWAAGATTSLLCGPGSNLERVDTAEYQVVAVLDDDAEATWLRAAVALHAVTPFTAVVALDDPQAAIAARIAEQLRLQGTNPLDVVTDAHDKVRLRERLRGAGGHQPLVAVAAHPDDVVAFGQRYGWPVVVKPTFGAGSTGVTVGVTPPDAEAAFARASAYTADTRTGLVHVEEQLDGLLLTVDTFTVAGEHHVLMIGFELFSTTTPSPLYFCTGIPAPITPDQWDLVRGTMVETLDALGVETGPAHSEVFLATDETGTDTVTVVEVQLRLGGDFPELTHRLTGVDLGEVWAQHLLGADVTEHLLDLTDKVAELDAAAVFLWGAPDVSGVLRSVETADGNRPPEPELITRREPPFAVRTVTTLDDVPVAVLGEGRTPRHAIQQARRALSAIRLRTEVEPVTAQEDHE